MPKKVVERQSLTATFLLGLAAALWLTGPVTAQSEGAFTSPEPAANTDGYNLLFFGNSYTHSSSNPSVNNPSYGGARGIAELVRRIAMAAGQDAPFAKMVYSWGKGYDYHLALSSPSLGEIDEPLLGAL